jgi:hypothetical protein
LDYDQVVVNRLKERSTREFRGFNLELTVSPRSPCLVRNGNEREQRSTGKRRQETDCQSIDQSEELHRHGSQNGHEHNPTWYGPPDCSAGNRAAHSEKGDDRDERKEYDDAKSC